MDTKRCSRCGETKDKSLFNRDAGKNDGLSYYCRECNREHCREHYRKDRTRYIEQARKYVKANSEAVAEYQKEYYKAHSTKLIARSVKHNRENPAWRKKIVAKYAKSHRKQLQAKKRLREKRLKDATPTWANIKAIRDFYVNCPEGHHVDHIIPIKAMRGRRHVACGLNWEGNLQYLIAHENSRKWARLPEELT